jgi:predicted nucleic acid-binding protein
VKYLLDTNMLLAAIVRQHQGQHAKTVTWLAGRQIVICPLVELGFLRISTNPRIPGMGFDMKQARASLERFVRERQADWIADDLPALKSHPARTDQVTDHYLADLAAKHGLKLATLDTQLKHPSVELVS